VIVGGARRHASRADATASTSRSTWARPSAARRRRARRRPPRHARDAGAAGELGGRYFQLRLEEPIVARVRRPAVIRSLAPPDTLGGGVVLGPAPAPPLPEP
jgi:selenocysteine-specific elongation factor